jgi:hypothetical protein
LNHDQKSTVFEEAMDLYDLDGNGGALRYFVCKQIRLSL